MKAKFINEKNISFQRGLDTKDALGINTLKRSQMRWDLARKKLYEMGAKDIYRDEEEYWLSFNPEYDKIMSTPLDFDPYKTYYFAMDYKVHPNLFMIGEIEGRYSSYKVPFYTNSNFDEALLHLMDLMEKRYSSRIERYEKNIKTLEGNIADTETRIDKLNRFKNK